jgi:hypothetical protein
MMSLLASGLEALEGLVGFWPSARRQRDMVKQRLRALLTATNRASDFNEPFCFGRRMQSLFGLDQDIVYGFFVTLPLRHCGGMIGSNIKWTSINWLRRVQTQQWRIGTAVRVIGNGMTAWDYEGWQEDYCRKRVQR